MATAKKKPAKKKPGTKAAATKKARPAARAPHPTGGAATFGPEFFAGVLPRMVAACPCPEDREPVCIVHLASGEELDVVEVLAVADRFVLLAVFEGTGDDGVARTEDDVGVEAVPYELVLRISVRRTTRRVRLGFHFKRDELAAATAEADGVARKNGTNGASGKSGKSGKNGKRTGRQRAAADPAEAAPATSPS